MFACSLNVLEYDEERWEEKAGSEKIIYLSKILLSQRNRESRVQRPIRVGLSSLLSCPGTHGLVLEYTSFSRHTRSG